MSIADIAAFDVVVVGAGFAGLYAIHRVRAMGLSVRCLEAGEGVGGTWYWNRYPGARCDVESMQYSYSFDEALQQEWEWTERYAAQPEILRYLNHVADRFDLRRDIDLNTRVVSAIFDEKRSLWRLVTAEGAHLAARHCIMATGCLSAARTPDLSGLDDFSGRIYHTGYWPREGADLAGQRVAVIGTGSSGIQAVPAIAAVARSVHVFQRTPNYSIPARNRPMTSAYQKEWKDSYAERRRYAREECPSGVVRVFGPPSAMQLNESEREEIYWQNWERGGADFMAAFGDLITNAESNETAAAFVRERIGEIVKDPRTAEALTPRGYPIGTKRICVDTDYFETFNRDNVVLVDLRREPLETITQRGVRTAAGEYEFDILVMATGFDALTGALSRIDIRGRGDEKLVDKWAAGPRTYLGLMSAGFPNLFMVTGPGSPSVISNVVVSIEQHVEWITDCIRHMEEAGVRTIEPEPQSEDGWVAHVNEIANATLYPRAASWYMGANIPGKPRVFLPYVGGVHKYRALCTGIARNGYEGFRLETTLGGGVALAERPLGAS